MTAVAPSDVDRTASRVAAAPAPAPAPKGAEEVTVVPSDVPDRPDLAEGVELSGRMEDSAFEEHPWLILRDGAFVQVTELLYRLAEACTGENDHAAIAASVSDAVGRHVTAGNVHQLLERKLIPMGIVPKTDGSIVPSAKGASGRSPLQINLRTAQVPPRIIEPLARAFKFLFLPPVVVAVLGLAVTGIGWVIVGHGLGAGFHGAMYAPWLIVALVPIIISSAAFHEFGHAAALAYGGGKVRGMGAGIYLVYPVFFTDVTDNYRLKRAGKIRTDLGGFYFNLITVLGMLALFLVTGWEFLLLAVVAIVFGIVHQLMPVVRLDGYWTLADMTGIPDPFSAMRPFLRSLVPLPGWRGQGPEMKRWVKAVFLIYILVTIPLLFVLMLYTVAIAPRIVGTAIDSFGRQIAELQPALAQGDAVAVAARILGLLVLALTSLGMVVFLFRTGRSVLRKMWEWAGESWHRRAAARTATLAMAGGLVLLWAPPLPAAGTPIEPFQAFRPIEEGETLTFDRAVQSAGMFTGDGGEPAASPSFAPDSSSAPNGSSAPGGAAPAPGSSTAPAPGSTPRPAATAAPATTPAPPANDTPAPADPPAPTPEGTPVPTEPPSSPSPPASPEESASP
jgi:putative peptide zinc metalloprotease protein